MASGKKNISNIAFNVIICTILVKAFGAFRDLTLSYCFGIEPLADSYLLATTIPVTIFAFIYEGIGASFIPACAKLKTKEEENLLTNRVINLLIILTIIMILLIEIFPIIVVKIFASGFSGEILKQTIFILRISIIGVIFSSIVYVIVYYLNNNDSFIIPVLRSIPMDIIVIASLFISKYTNSIIPMTVGIPISLLIELLFLLPHAVKKGYKYKFSISLNDENVKNIIKWSIPIVITTSISDINSIIDRQFSSWILTGGISILTYSSRTLNVVRTAIFIPIITVLFPKFSKDLNCGKYEEVSSISTKAFSTLIILSVPMTFGLLILSQNVIQILFQRGAFDLNSTIITSECLKYYSIALIGYAFLTITTKLFHSMTDMKTPMYISAIGVVVNVIANLFFSRLFGIEGLAIGTSISTIFMAMAQYIILNKKFHFNNKYLIITFVKAILLSTIMLILLLWIKPYFTDIFGVLFSTIFLIIIGVLIFFIGCIIFRVDELKYVLKFKAKK